MGSRQPKCRAARRGVALLLAILFLALFASLAVAIAASADINLTISRNRMEGQQASALAETGVQLIMRNIGGLTVTTAHNATDMHTLIANKLSQQLAGTHMLNPAGISSGSSSVTVPTATITRPDGRIGYIDLTVQASGGAQDNTTVTVRSTGRFGGASRTATYNMTVQRGRSVLLDYGVASKGVIQMQGHNQINGANVAAEGNAVSDTYSTTDAIQLGGNCSISGDAAVCNPAGNITVGKSSSIGGQRIRGAPEGDWPQVDITPFKQYATNTYSGSDTMTNVRIPPYTDPSFKNDTTIYGVLYIQSPNKVEFKGTVTVIGCIVCDPPNVPNLSANQISFKATVNAQGVEHLPTGAQFDGLRDLTGSFLLAPGFSVSNWANSNLVIEGNMVASAFNFGGGADTRVKGGILNLSDNPFQMGGNATITIDHQGIVPVPAGLVDGYLLVCVSGSYAE